MQDSVASTHSIRSLGPRKRLVIFADGTGSAFSSQESNVWRLYQALDKSEGPDGVLQLARYIPGVGTSAVRVIRVLDGATGFGVPANVRKLYRFLCWNWQVGDQIHLIGFSRGSFTVRTLAGLVASQGLMPRHVTSAEMDRNALAAWWAYRAETAPLFKDGRLRMNPLISVARGLRDALTWTKRKILGQPTHREVQASLPKARRPGNVKIRFMGVFDTVEAYGLPVKEMLHLVDVLIWPLHFRNWRCSPVVATVRHALSLDEERRSFVPLRFDQSPRPDGKPQPQIDERWFAGVHADVGGGYANDENAFQPLLWMADEAKGLLDFDDVALGRYRAQLFPQALIHNSRAGLAMFYRYGPREVAGGEVYGGPPVVDVSVVRKIREGADGYAPLTLPEEFRVATDRAEGPQVQGGLKRDPEAAARVSRLIGWRTATNWITILSILWLVVLPLLNLFRACRAGPDGGLLDCAVSVVFGAASGLPGEVIDNWQLYLAPAVLLAAMVAVNGTLESRIKDASRALWRPLPLQSPQGEG